MGLFSGFTGNAQRSDLDRGYTQAQGALAAGNARGNTYYDKATANYQPFIDRGNTGAQAYQNALGLNGPGAAEGAYADYSSNPGLRDAAALGVKYAAQRYNAGPGLNSGAAYAGLGQTSLGYYDQYLNRLAGLGEQGFNATGQQAGAYERQGDFNYKYGQDSANNDISHASGVAGTRNVLGQNIIGLTGAIAGGLGAANGLGFLPKFGGKAGGSGASSGMVR